MFFCIDVNIPLRYDGTAKATFIVHQLSPATIYGHPVLDLPWPIFDVIPSYRSIDAGNMHENALFIVTFHLS